MGEQRHHIRNSTASLTGLLSINCAAFLAGEFVLISPGVAAHPAATRRWGIDNFADQLGIVSYIPTPVKSTSCLQPDSMVTAQGALHILHGISPRYGRHPAWARPVV
jgi:hypothetical protein